MVGLPVSPHESVASCATDDVVKCSQVEAISTFEGLHSGHLELGQQVQVRKTCARITTCWVFAANVEPSR
jgi:FAD synthase